MVVLFYVVSFVLPLLLLELCARVVLPPVSSSFQRKHAQIIEILGLRALNDIMIPDPVLFWKLKPNLRNFVVDGLMAGQPVLFHVSTSELGLRGPSPGPAGQARRILVLGDSCAFGVGVEGEQTWPAQLEQILNGQGGRKIEVINGGVPGYTAYQGTTYLTGRGLSLRPDLVIAAFGFNDASSWGSRSDPEIAESLRVGQWDEPLMRSRLYAGMKELALLIRPPRAPKEGDRPRLPPEVFYRTLLEMNAACSREGIPLILVIWPYAVQAADRNATLLRYQPLVERAGKEADIPVVSLVEPFLQPGQLLFLDHIHANADGCRAAAETIAPRARTVLGDGR